MIDRPTYTQKTIQYYIILFSFQANSFKQQKSHVAKLLCNFSNITSWRNNCRNTWWIKIRLIKKLNNTTAVDPATEKFISSDNATQYFVYFLWLWQGKIMMNNFHIWFNSKNEYSFSVQHQLFPSLCKTHQTKCFHHGPNLLQELSCQQYFPAITPKYYKLILTSK